MRTNQKGFTLIELLAVMGISAILLGVLVPTIYQITRHTDLNNIRITAVNQIENTAHWLSQDVQLAQKVTVFATRFTLSWTDWTDWSVCTGQSYPDEEADFKSHSITYSQVGDEIQRNYDGSITTIARYISDFKFSVTEQALIVTITSSPRGEDWPTEKRTYKINLRPVADSPLR